MIKSRLIHYFLFILILVSCEGNSSNLGNDSDLPYDEDTLNFIESYEDENEEILENGELNGSFTDEETNDSINKEQKFQLEKQKLLDNGWKEEEIINGQLPNCYNYQPKISKIDNRLEIIVGGGTDVVIKLMKKDNDKCIRYVFVNSGSSYSIRNIPEAKYYLKIAYGTNWFSKVEKNKCIGKFIRNPIYEKGEDILDFNLKYEKNGYSIPSYRLELDVVSNTIVNSFNSQNISEENFNN